MAEIEPSAIEATYERIARYVRQTPFIAIDVDGITAPVTLKLECLQHTGSFKARGAFANLTMLEVPEAGVVAASGGNHGAAVAYAARQLGIPARIFVPAIASPSKTDRIREYGAELVIGGDRYADALAASEAYIAESGAIAIHAYDQPGTLLGQGTVGLEFERQASEVDTVLVAVGGGGLIGGITAWYKGRKRVVAVEPTGAPTLNAALQAGRPVDVEVSGIAADSLGARRVGNLMFPIAQAHVADSILVSDEAISNAQRWLWDRLRIVTEPGGATALAALLSGVYSPTMGERIGVVICGANTTIGSFAQT